MRALQASSNGKPADVLEIVNVAKPVVGPGQVLIRVSAASLNFNDIDRCYGRRLSVPTPPPFILGMDACGTVVQCGEGAEEWLHQRVVAVTNQAIGGLAEYAIASKNMVFPAPDSLNDTEAAAFIIPFHTAYLGVVQRAKLQEHETLLVHAGASSVGSAAIQLGKAMGAKVIATVSSQAKKNYCLSLGADHVINHTTTDFTDDVLDLTNNIGSEVIFDLAGGQFVEPSWRCIAIEGRYLSAGFADDEENGFSGRPLRPTCFGNFSIMGFMMAYTETNSPDLRKFGVNLFSRKIGQSVHTELLQLLNGGTIKPNIDCIVSLEEAAEALTQQENRKTLGKSVVLIRASS